MKRFRISLWIALGVALFVCVSCSRAPQEGGLSSSAGSSGEDANAASPEQTPAAVETREQPKNDSDPPTEHFSGMDIDINSGDFRGIRPTLDPARQYVIFESELSTEARRLGIPIPQERRWKGAGRMSTGGVDVYFVYESLPAAMYALIRTLNEVQATDDERRDVLWKFMTSLRTDPPSDALSQAWTLRDEVSKRHGLDE